VDPAFEQLRAAAEILHVPLTPRALVGLGAYTAELLRWRERLNLTGADTAAEVVNPHLIDVCLAVAKVRIPEGASVVDIGTGAGLPGIPLKLIRPGLAMVLVETSRKKVSFLEHVRSVLDLGDLRIEHGRAEAVGHKPECRERFDVSLTQATADLSVGVELILPFVRVGGAGVCLKGAGILEEVSEAMALIDVLGGQIESSEEYALPTTATKRTVVVIRKVRSTPEEFARSSRALGRPPASHKGT